MQGAHVESGVPRFVALKVFVPVVNQQLPDWEVVEGNMEQVKGSHNCI